MSAKSENLKHSLSKNNVNFMGLDVHNPVFFISAAAILLFVVLTLISPESAKKALDGAKWWSINSFDWLFMSSGNLFVLFCLFLIISPVSKIRLGGANASPEFSHLSWFSMLFAAGMGIGLMFWSVAEPVAYYTKWWFTPLNVAPNTPEALSAAMGATMFHWGLHPWSMYAIVGLAIAFATFNKKLPLTIRSAFYPLFGDLVWGWLGHIIDILAVFATLFGLATSLGLGAQQASAGLEFLFGIENGVNTQIVIIIAVTSIAIVSVARGLEAGVKVLSGINMALAFALVLFVIIVGPAFGLFESIAFTLKSYVEYLVPLSNWVGREDTDWFHGWTVFYWAWWISWSPFVGMFIARISKGRTVREFITAVLLIPTLVTLVWMSLFGESALMQIVEQSSTLKDGFKDVSLAMYQMLDALPLSTLTSFIAIVLVLVFFITSSDSGSLVIDSITSGGKVDAPTSQRIFWASLEGLIAAVLLYVGGKEALSALQAGAITTALPFTIVLLLMCISLYKGLSKELKH